MSNIVSAAQSSVGKKFITGLTGFALGLFVIMHLTGNLLLLLGHDGRPFNDYAHFLETLGHGFLLPIAEVGLALVFLFHIVTGIQIALRKRQARPVGYYSSADAGHTSSKTASSKTMIWTGLILMVFVVLHVVQFRIANLFNHRMVAPDERDLYSLVYTAFHDSLLWVVLYCSVMLMLGLHLRHGFWSAFQSLGLNNSRWKPFLFSFAVLFAVVMALGFFILPIYIHFAPDYSAVSGGTP